MTRRVSTLAAVAAVAAVVAVALAGGLPAEAHRLDEFLQATRLQPGVRRVTFRFDLTPGVAVAGEVLGRLDANRDAKLSGDEERAYGESLLKEVEVLLNGRPLTLRLDRVTASPVGELKEGEGTLRVTAHADFEALAAGAHQLRLINNHLPAISVYLVNAITPADPRVTVVRQVRSRNQREYRVDFEVAAPGP